MQQETKKKHRHFFFKKCLCFSFSAIFRENQALSIPDFRVLCSSIIPQQETSGNYNEQGVSQPQGMIIPQQETSGNYNAGGAGGDALQIIPQQELSGNYKQIHISDIVHHLVYGQRKEPEKTFPNHTMCVSIGQFTFDFFAFRQIFLRCPHG